LPSDLPSCFLLNDTPTTNPYPLSLHDALPIYRPKDRGPEQAQPLGDLPADQARSNHQRDLGKAGGTHRRTGGLGQVHTPPCRHEDRKSTRLNSSHVKISYAVFCLKKKKK